MKLSGGNRIASVCPESGTFEQSEPHSCSSWNNYISAVTLLNRGKYKCALRIVNGIKQFIRYLTSHYSTFKVPHMIVIWSYSSR
jgi:hypothetical protein